MRQLFALALLAFSTTLFAQLNATLRSNLDYAQDVNDVWGYVAPDGTEYAIVGIQTGVSFVSLADPDNATEVAFIPGDGSNWRDMKTFGEYAYNVADQGNEGISAFDLRFLPDSVPFKKTTYPNIIGNGEEFIQAHNLYIDTEKGWLYTAGGSRRINDGGILIFDINDDPLTPRYIGKAPDTYSHDVYSKGDTLYCSEIYDGELALYDISDIDNPVELGTTLTPFLFTHNAWTTDDAQTIFTTDERANAPVGAYDISDPQNIEKLFEFRPLESLNTGTIPHNVHVIDDYLSISYYTDGLVVADASKPDNIIEVANWDTFLGANGGFNGCWGAYPFLPSGLTLASDRQTGLYVIDVDYKRAARLEGVITDADLGTPINNVSVTIAADQTNFVNTNAVGTYKTGLANAGTYQVTFSAENYESLTVSVDMLNDVCLRLDTVLKSNVARFNLRANVVDDATGEAIPTASIRVINGEESIDLLTDDNGEASLNAVFDDDFNVYVAEWGYQTLEVSDQTGADLSGATFRLKRGYMDDFVTDEGWSSTADNNVRRGQWDRGVPQGTVFDGQFFAPNFDADGDIGEEAYVTGIPNETAGSDDVDGGVVTLTSPKFGPLNLENLRVSYQYWFANAGGSGTPNDALTISITNGIETKEVRSYNVNTPRDWIVDSFLVADFVTVNDDLQLIVQTSDFDDNGHLVEAGFDNFLVDSGNFPLSAEDYTVDNLQVTIFPNPTAAAFRLDYTGTAAVDQLIVTDVNGRQVLDRQVTGASVTFGLELPAGVYFAELRAKGSRVYTGKVVKE